MKRGIILLGILLLGVISLQAKEVDRSIHSKLFYTHTNGIQFIEGNIRFNIHLNGNFSFEELGRRHYRRNAILIRRDRIGRITRVGDVWISYYRNGDVRRIGSVFIQYRRGRLSRVGNLWIRYNRYGDPLFSGRVRGFGYYQPLYNPVVYNYYDDFFYRNSFRNNYYQFREDTNFYYYKYRGSNTSKKETIIKRRKNKDSSTTRSRRG